MKNYLNWFSTTWTFFHPLRAMPQTPLMMGFKSQEYLGFSSHWVYLAPLFKECLLAETGSSSDTTSVASVIDGTLRVIKSRGWLVSNIGNDINWCGHPMAQSNWYAFGRLVWGSYLTASGHCERVDTKWHSQIGRRSLTLFNQSCSLREVAVSYMTPLWLHHHGLESSLRPGPWYKGMSRADWRLSLLSQSRFIGHRFR